MLGFRLEKDKIKKIINEFSNQYNISDELFQNILKIVDEYVYVTNHEPYDNKSDQYDNDIINKDNYTENINKDEICSDHSDNGNEIKLQIEQISNEFENLEKNYDVIDK